MKSSNLGYPRIGEKREWKKALEAYWSGKLEEEAFHAELKAIRLRNLKKQKEQGIDCIPVGDFSYYDHILDTATMFGIVPGRFGYEGGKPDLQTYYAMARGTREATACAMTKWFNTNYHYIVPELEDRQPQLTANRPLEAYREAKTELGIEGRPVIVGLYTFLKLSKGYTAEELESWIDRLLPLYGQVLRELETEGVEWVQIDEPILVTTLDQDEMKLVARIYDKLAKEAPGVKLLLQTYFEAVDYYKEVVALPVHGIGLDFVHDGGRNLKAVRELGFPSDKVLGAGLIDGRGVWRADLTEILETLNKLAEKVPADHIFVQPSCSLLHVPVSAAQEQGLEPTLREALAFAGEKLEEVALLAKGAHSGPDAIRSELDTSARSRQTLQQSPSRNRRQVHERMTELASQPSTRQGNVQTRREAHQKRWNLPLLPTTTIGSFPQTPEIRSSRQKWRKGEWSDAQYETFIQEQIKTWIGLQAELGLDVFVHGEFERNDMVEFFGEKLAGFAFTANGWVQSYGSRCVKPPIIYGDVEFTAPMTVTETVYAQSLTAAPVKGMLTGPVTILNWSFVRDDKSREEVAYQIALALRDEVEALEASGIGMIQVDEPAIREGLPLKREQGQQYLDWTVRAFRLCTSTVKDETQIHTHMCYSDFHNIIDSISALDADVISIETSRSHGELIESFEAYTYDKGIGLGVFDIHSPRVPQVEEIGLMIDRALRVLAPDQFWINPDCGLKTRKYEETIASLRNMVQATEQAREKYAVKA
ncbi:5-methyltetrahydropteroyltriglutamate--homocysteine S-methyltransferase [Paenibacillus nasutitermitis]|uniref:5-methyltetrahydropteroyltriglutamate--homocysteine methyltransferase n=1 Tax=Paenibacillus nasutitermitis TaxID=1652958 RepID=A0A916YTF6_9BACL|nr:5-methyltetrahydropteroyltriglutamate--homocysteine S-methyltransferase [Paenibacillus nasutitermitis]GGD59754.1 5-methyltetrahydropteroyltriglutamate--homocysteine methyltransferase [Paenibacillus nasutitermitis]